MQLIERAHQSVDKTQRLQRRYFRLTMVIGLIAIAIATVVVVLVVHRAHGALGIGVPFSEPTPAEGLPGRFALWIVIAFASIPVAFYLSGVVVAGGYACVQLILGSMTLGEAVLFALFGKYPSFWYETARDRRRMPSTHRPDR